MHALRRSRRIGRLLAVWLLLWFVAMTSGPVVLAPSVEDHGRFCSMVPFASGAAHAGHLGHEKHNLRACDDGPHDSAHGAHAGHASHQHCPLCMHAAVPPPTQFAQDFANASLASALVAVPPAHPRVRATVPPPARGPPPIS